MAPAAEAAPPSPPPGPSNDDYEKLIGGDTHNPHGILGAHPQGDGTTVVRTLRHHAQSVTLLHGRARRSRSSTPTAGCSPR